MNHKIINADVYAALKNIPDNSIDVAITSPPYWAQRNYGFDEQIGNEKTYLEFISKLVFIFHLLKQKLTDKGVFFLNIGDKYLKKYGNTPIGLIPYKLAFFMQQDGWIINDTLIWYKPNHLPSSVKNRFANSYEPVFALSKKKENHFRDYQIKKQDYSNILKINLQPTSYNHIAVYPEKLVSSLLEMTIINKDYTILDPFAGSGTTLKVINDKNNSLFSKNEVKGVMIEYNKDYIEIIKQRTGLLSIDVKEYPYLNYEYQILEENFVLNNDYSEYDNIETVSIAENRTEFNSYLKTILTKSIIRSFPKNELLFIGLRDFSIEDIYNISQINKKSWIIRNMLVCENERKWFPIFMVVQDTKKEKYLFNYKNLKLNHKSKEVKNYKKEYLGYKVVDNFSKIRKEGKIISILEFYKIGLPKYVKVYWADRVITKEFIINDEESLIDNLNFLKINGILKVSEKKEFIPLVRKVKNSKSDYSEIKTENHNKNYNGKFREINRKNWGASPGARSSVEDEYFSRQRLYPVDQKIVADYLNYIRKKNHLSKKAFTELFSKEYKHTVGHWLRKDFGGSIPLLEDWKLLEKLFEIDLNFTKYVCKTGLKLQTVKKTKYKIPDDMISYEMIKKLENLNKP